MKKISSKQKLLPKLIIILSIIFILCSSLIYYFIVNWESGRNPKIEDEVGVMRSVKQIYFVNNTNQSISIIINFKYSKDEILKYSNINLDYNRVDTILNLQRKKNESFSTPILFGNVSNFPNDFNIKVTDSTGKTIEQFDKNSFFKNIENHEGEELKASSWTIKI